MSASRTFSQGAICAAVVSFTCASPSFADSEFDRFVRSRGGLPETFEELLSQGSAYCEGKPDNQKVSILPVVDSRSLQRAHTSLAQPRRLGSFCGTFVGYSEKANALEVISNDPSTGEPAFYVVTNFGISKKQPGIQRQSRDLPACIQCHQHGGLIFTRGPWSEMDGGRVKQVDGSLGTQPKALSAQINQERARIGLPAWENSTTPIRIKRPPTASGYDSEIRGFNRGMQINRACREICGQDLDCRRLFLIQALMHGFIQRGFSTGSDPNSPRYKLAIELLDANLSKLLLQMKQRWPSHGFEQVASVIADRDPFTHAKEGGQTERFEVTDARAFLKHWNDDRQKRGLALLPAEYGTLSAAEITRMLQYDSTNPFIHAFEDPAIGLKGVPGVELRHTEGFIGNSKANPKKERPMADKIGDPAKLESFSWQKLGDFCFGHMPRDWDYLDGLSPQAVQDQILGSSPGAKALLEPWPPSRESIQTTLRVLLKSQSNCADCSSGANSSVSPLLPGQIKSIEQVSSSLRPNASMTDKFNFYCARCHKTGPARELPLDNLSGLAKYGEGLVIDRLEGVIDDIMPPTRPRDIPRPSDETRKEMIEALRVIVRKNGNAAGK